MNGSRVYHQRMFVVTFRAYGLFGFVAGVSIAAAPHLAASLRALIVVAAFVWLYYTWAHIGRRGVEVTPDGIYVKRDIRRRYIPWQEIETFKIKRPATSPPVYVELVSGELRMLPLTQGRKVRWQEGSTRDIVTVLNGELDQARTRAQVS